MVTNTPARPRRTRTGAVVPALLLPALLMLAGLTGCFPADTAPTPTPVATASEDVTGLPEGVQQATDVPLDVPNLPELRDDVELTTCEEADGGWKAAGTVTNSGADSMDYTITVFFTTDGGTVIGTGDTEVAVAAGESEDWSITSALTPAPGTNCVLRGVG